MTPDPSRPSGGAYDPATSPLAEVLEAVARARHDLNNSLTAALAEVQLLLLENRWDSDTRESLQAIESQLRRMRDVVASTLHLPNPSQNTNPETL